jgi:hypothetical protein
MTHEGGVGIAPAAALFDSRSTSHQSWTDSLISSLLPFNSGMFVLPKLAADDSGP